MPVRIYDISKKLGLENKEVLSKAKELGIAAARVASSSLDKITAEYLEQQLILAHPNLAAGPAAAPQPAHVQEPIMLVRAPEEEPQSEVSAPPVEVSEPAEPVAEIAGAPAEPVAKAPPPPPPPPPAGPKVG